MAERLPRIAGTIHRADGEAVQFHITDEGFAQWGVAPSQLGPTADLLDALTEAARGTAFFVPAEPEPGSSCPADCSPDNEDLRGRPCSECGTDWDKVEALTTAAMECIQHHHGFGMPDGCPIAALVPQDIMPTPETFAAVYAITGTTEEERIARAAGKFKTTPTTESGWARVMLRRWAIKQAPSTPFYN